MADKELKTLNAILDGICKINKQNESEDDYRDCIKITDHFKGKKVSEGGVKKVLGPFLDVYNEFIGTYNEFIKIPTSLLCKTIQSLECVSKDLEFIAMFETGNIFKMASLWFQKIFQIGEETALIIAIILVLVLVLSMLGGLMFWINMIFE